MQPVVERPALAASDVQSLAVQLASLFQQYGQNLNSLIRLANFETSETAANIADATETINTENKYEGKFVWDVTNLRLLRASGDGATDDWEVVDGSAQVTPA